MIDINRTINRNPFICEDQTGPHWNQLDRIRTLWTNEDKIVVILDVADWLHTIRPNWTKLDLSEVTQTIFILQLTWTKLGQHYGQDSFP